MQKTTDRYPRTLIYLSPTKMSHLILVLVTVLVGVLFETVLRKPTLDLVEKFLQKRRKRKLFEFNGDLYITKSFPPADTLQSRECDNIVERLLEPLIKNASGDKVQIWREDPKTARPHPDSNLIIIGSTKYNRHAELLQKDYATKFEYVFDLHARESDSKILKITNQYGDEYVSSSDFKTKRAHVAIDYGILFHARRARNRRILWISGIHGQGTLGVFKHLQENPQILSNSMSVERPEGEAWFFRIKYDHTLPDSMEQITDVQLIDHAWKCPMRELSNKPKALICDLGNVIMLFDRSITYRAIGHWLHLPFSVVKSKIEKSGIVEQYEKGEHTTPEFHALIMSLFKGSGDMSFELFQECWGDIFWQNRNMMEALRFLKNEVTLVLLSNTNEIHFTDVMEHYADVIELFEDRLVLSFKEKMTKDNREIFDRARKMAGPNVKPAECIYVDDKAEYVNMANEMGMTGVVYFSYPQFVFSMREVGIYLP